MTINEILGARGLDEDAIQGVLDDLRENKLFFASEENMDIRYGTLKEQSDVTARQLQEAQETIKTLKQATEGQEDTQQKIAEYEAREKALREELAQTKVLFEAKLALKDAGALDVDYLRFKLQEKGELELDENGKIKGWEDKLAGLKTQMPTMFEGKGGRRNILENRLPNWHTSRHSWTSWPSPTTSWNGKPSRRTTDTSSARRASWR